MDAKNDVLGRSVKHVCGFGAGASQKIAMVLVDEFKAEKLVFVDGLGLTSLWYGDKLTDCVHVNQFLSGDPKVQLWKPKAASAGAEPPIEGALEGL